MVFCGFLWFVVVFLFFWGVFGVLFCFFIKILVLGVIKIF